LRAAFARPGYKPEVLAMGTNTDPYQPIEARFGITRAVLELCLETRHPVSITTKSARLTRDIDLLADLARLELVVVMLSVTTLDPELARAMEPRASAPHRRIAAIRALSQAGVPAFVSASPMIPGLNDHELEAILEAAAQVGAMGAFCLAVRLPHEVAPLFEEWLEVHQPDRKAKVLNAIRGMRDGKLNDPRFGERMRPKGEWGQLLRFRLAAAKRRHGLDGERLRLRTDLFMKPETDARQGRLF
jgi:DNA repair photolyase